MKEQSTETCDGVKTGEVAVGATYVNGVRVKPRLATADEKAAA